MQLVFLLMVPTFPPIFVTMYVIKCWKCLLQTQIRPVHHGLCKCLFVIPFFTSFFKLDDSEGVVKNSWTIDRKARLSCYSHEQSINKHLTRWLLRIMWKVAHSTRLSQTILSQTTYKSILSWSKCLCFYCLQYLSQSYTTIWNTRRLCMNWSREFDHSQLSDIRLMVLDLERNIIDYSWKHNLTRLLGTF